jgi:serine/threonine protein kinase
MIESISKEMKSQVGTTIYMSPEMIREEQYFSSTDIWSLGCVLYELVTLNHPFSYNNFEYIIMISKYSTPNYNFSQYSELKGLVQQMLCYEPSKRISISNIENFPLFTKYNQDISFLNLENIKSKIQSLDSNFSSLIANSYFLYIHDIQMNAESNSLKSKLSLLKSNHIHLIKGLKLKYNEAEYLFHKLFINIKKQFPCKTLLFTKEEFNIINQ